MKSTCVLKLAVLGLIVLGLASMIGSVLLLFQEREVPDGIIAMGSACVGAIATLLVRSPGDEP